MNYKSFADLSKDIKLNLHKIPKEVTLVVGIPRSGLLAANLISLYTNLPLTDIDSFIEGKVLCPSFQDSASTERAFTGKILIVDDSVATGKAIIDAKQKLQPIMNAASYELLFCCVYADPEKKHLVDIPLLLLNRPRVFEWNLFHNKIMENSGVNLPGILAVDANRYSLPDNIKHFKTLLNTVPYIIPKKSIGTVFYASPKENQTATEKWLLQNGVQFSELLQKDDLDIASEYKKRKNLTLFIESRQQEAQHLYESTGKDVYCLENNIMYSNTKDDGMAASLPVRSKRFLSKIKRKIETFI